MGWTRRQFLRAGASSVALASLSCGRRTQDKSAPPVAAPKGIGARYVAILYLDGGIDPILTVNPRTRDQLAADVDGPVDPGQIVEAGEIHLGPHFAPLKPWASRMAVVNGVHLDTANHNTGWGQITRLRTGVTDRMPGILDILAEHRDGQPLGTISFGDLAPIQYTPGHTDGERVFGLHDSNPEQLGDLGAALEAEAAGMAAAGQDPRILRTAENYRSIGRLAERLKDVPKFTPAPWSPLGDKDRRIGNSLQRILWAFEHDLTRCAFIKVRPYGGWDSHNHNLLRQRNTSKALTEVLVEFLKQLEGRKNAHGTLADQTLLVIGSEIGRFPRLNDNAGKDHYPETSYLLMGAGIGRGVFGITDNRMSGVLVDPDSGKKAMRGGHRIRLDDLGATVLASVGIAPEPYGYRGRVLRFLQRRAA